MKWIHPARSLAHVGAGLVLVAWLTSGPVPLATADDLRVVEFDLRSHDQAVAWRPQRDIAAATPTPDGLELAISGEDPYLIGPARDYPPGMPLLLTLRMASEEGGSCQVFYFDISARESHSVRFDVRAGGWQETCIPLPPLGPGYRLRIDPPGTKGRCRLARVALAARHDVRPPAWPKPSAPAPGAATVNLQAGDLRLRHAPGRWGEFALDVAGERVAVGGNRPLIGYLGKGGPAWIDVAAKGETKVTAEAGSLHVNATVTDEEGVNWSLRQRFAPLSRDAIEVRTEVEVSADRPVIFLPTLLVFPGLGTHGEHKGQGLLAGVEYLDDEPSSSEADLEGPESRRRVPDANKITFPLMAITSGNHYVGMIWDQAPELAALFDSPDRVFGSGSHVMGLIAPGSSPRDRVDGEVLPYRPLVLKAKRGLVSRAILIGGQGRTVVPAIRQYLDLRGCLPGRRSPTFPPSSTSPPRAGSTPPYGTGHGFATPSAAASAPSRRPTRPG